MVVQLATYGVLGWMVFACVAFCGARMGGFWGMVVGQMLMAIMVGALDVMWIQAEMHRPDWAGVPDQDIVFVVGVMIRVVLVNTFLLPVSAVGWWLRGRAAFGRE